jgi:hypothetical protein
MKFTIRDSLWLTVVVAVAAYGLVGLMLSFGTSASRAQDSASTTNAQAESIERFRNLKEFQKSYWAYHEANWNKKGREAPRSWQDLEAVGLSRDVRKFLEANGFDVVVGIKYHELKNGTSEVMIAYSTQSFQYGPQQFGRLAVFMDGHASGMTDEEFKKSQKILEPYLKNAIVLPAAKPTR